MCPKVKVEPVFINFGSYRNYHTGWEGICPHCKAHWESYGTECDNEVYCNSCAEIFSVEYLQNCGLPTFF